MANAPDFTEASKKPDPQKPSPPAKPSEPIKCPKPAQPRPRPPGGCPACGMG